MPDNLKQSIVLTANDAVVYDSTIPVRKSWYENPDQFTNGYYPAAKGGKRRNNKRKSTKNGGRNRRMFSKRKQYRGI